MENLENNKKYNIGLDIGVASVGWCVTDYDSNILKKGKRNMWGSRIFDSAQTAKERRGFRGARRRISRRKQRIKILQSLLQETLNSEYPNFLPSLEESWVSKNDDTRIRAKYNLFNDKLNNLTDKEYYKNFKTIYHLREELATTAEKVDIRLVYLALHHIIKYRGNFLYNNEFTGSFEAKYDLLEVAKYYLTKQESIANDYELDFYIEDIELQSEYIATDLENILNTNSKSKEKEILIKELFKQNTFTTKEKEFNARTKNIYEAISKAIIGYKFNLEKLFELDVEKYSISLADDLENKQTEIENMLGDNTDIFESLKKVYSWVVLQGILGYTKIEGNKLLISSIFEKKYEEYKEDLKNLKTIYYDYIKDEYKDMFIKNDEKLNNYVKYDKNHSKLSQEEFNKVLKTRIEKLVEELLVNEDLNKEKLVLCENVLLKLEEKTFLTRLNTTDNGAIPHQLHGIELEKILDNQSEYYPELAKNKDKILALFEFRIPYYIGPLAKINKFNSKENNSQNVHSWIIRKSDEAIRPWNFNEVVDRLETAEKFITEMTSNCTYFINEKSMPACSLLYSKYNVLNELNNIRIKGKKLDKELKEFLIENCFLKYNTVTKKIVQKALRVHPISNGQENIEISGLTDDKTFMSSLRSYRDMMKLFNIEKIEDITISQEKMFENLIRYITIFEDKNILKEKIKVEYGTVIPEDIIKELVKKKYPGWSSLSKKLLTQVRSKQGKNIIEILEDEKMNFMQIINDSEIGVKDELDKILSENVKELTKITYEDVDQIPGNPSIKRGIWQAVQIIEEIIRVMKCEPENIYIEFARGDEEKGFKGNRVEQLKKKYEEIKANDPEYYNQLKDSFKNELKNANGKNRKEFDDRMYLYFIQSGKCMYTGEELDINKILEYENDHIIARANGGQDELDNRALVLRKENQRKTNELLSEDIIYQRINWWKRLQKNGLISKRKLENLTKTVLFRDDEDRKRFVQRQLVETRQISKHVKNLLISRYTNTKVRTLKSRLTDYFRTHYQIIKIRELNDLHHAHDAYIISVVGNAIFKGNNNANEDSLYETMTDYLKGEKGKIGVIGKINNYSEPRIGNIKQLINSRNVYLTKKVEETSGAFYDQTIYSKDSNKGNLKSLKDSKDTAIYGGYSSTKLSYSTIFTYINKKGEKEYFLKSIPVKTVQEIKQNKTTLKEYILNNIIKDTNITEFKIVKAKVYNKQIFIDELGNKKSIVSESEFKNAEPLIVDEYIQKILLYLYDEKKYMKLFKNKEDKKENNENISVDFDIENKIDEAYEYLLEKFTKDKVVKLAALEKIFIEKEQFYLLSFEDKKHVIFNLIKMYTVGQGDLKKINLSIGLGKEHGKNYNTELLSKIKFIDQSITGMFERKYDIYELENRNNK